jgi:hypothetical protein
VRAPGAEYSRVRSKYSTAQYSTAQHSTGLQMQQASRSDTDSPTDSPISIDLAFHLPHPSLAWPSPGASECSVGVSL